MERLRCLLKVGQWLTLNEIPDDLPNDRAQIVMIDVENNMFCVRLSDESYCYFDIDGDSWNVDPNTKEVLGAVKVDRTDDFFEYR